MKRQTIALFFAALLLPACGGETVTSPPPDTPASTGAQSSVDEPEKTPEKAPDKAAAPTAEKPPEGKTEPEKGAEPDHGPEPAAAPSDVPGANLTIGQLEADGLKAKDIACKTEGGGGMALLGAVLVTAWMSPQKKALDACAPAGTETRVVWKARGGKVTEIVAKGDAKTKACVERALSGGKPVLEGQCAATLVHGK